MTISITLTANRENPFEEQYHNAITLMEAGNYEDAIDLFEKLHDYEDSESKMIECHTAILQVKYNNALIMLDEGKIVEAYEMLIAMENYPAGVEKAKTIYPLYVKETLRNAVNGDTIYLGTYEQDNLTSNGAEALEWLVLKVDDGKALLISRYGLDVQPYHDLWESADWETCSLRAWLNDNFLQTAFSNEEQEMILISTIPANLNSYYPNTPQGNAVKDKLFLLSMTEVKTYFSSNTELVCQATAYAIGRGASRAGCNWWLRTLGRDEESATHVWTIGGINEYGVSFRERKITIRPAMWIELPQ